MQFANNSKHNNDRIIQNNRHKTSSMNHFNRLKDEKSIYLQNLIQKNMHFKNLGTKFSYNITDIFPSDNNVKSSINHIKKINEQNKNNNNNVSKLVNESPILPENTNKFYNGTSVNLRIGNKTNHNIPLLIDRENLLDNNIYNKITNINKREYLNITFVEEDKKEKFDNEIEKGNGNTRNYINLIKNKNHLHNSTNNIIEKEKKPKLNLSGCQLENKPVSSIIGNKFLFNNNKYDKNKYINKSKAFIFTESFENKKKEKCESEMQIEHFSISICFHTNESNLKSNFWFRKENWSFSLCSKNSKSKENKKKRKNHSLDNINNIDTLKESDFKFPLKPKEDTNNTIKLKKTNQNDINLIDNDEYNDLTGIAVLLFNKGKIIKRYKCQSNIIEIDGFNKKFKEDEIKVNNKYLQFVELSKNISNKKRKNSSFINDIIETNDQSVNTFDKDKAKYHKDNKKFSGLTNKKNEVMIKKKELYKISKDEDNNNKFNINDNIENKIKKNFEVRKIERNESVYYSSSYKSKKELLLLNKIVQGDKISFNYDNIKKNSQSENKMLLEIQQLEPFLIQKNKYKEKFTNIIVKIPEILILNKKKETFETSSNTNVPYNQIEYIESLELNGINNKWNINNIINTIPQLELLEGKNEIFDFNNNNNPIEVKIKDQNEITQSNSDPRLVLNEIITVESIALISEPKENESAFSKNFEVEDNQSFQIIPKNKNIKAVDVININNEDIQSEIIVNPINEIGSNSIKNNKLYHLFTREDNKDEIAIISNQYKKEEKKDNSEKDNEPEIYDIIVNKPIANKKKKKQKFANFNEEYSKSKEIEEITKEVFDYAKLKAVQLRQNLKKGKK